MIFASVFVLIFFSGKKIYHGEINTGQMEQRTYKFEITNIKSSQVSEKQVLEKQGSGNKQPLGNENLYQSIITDAAEKHDVDPALIKAIIMAESGYDPAAISEKGAVGLMQLMPATAYSLGVKDLFDPEHNINAGVRYFKGLLNKYEGDLNLALAAYNAGSTNVRKYQGIPPYKTTHNYIKRVFKYYYQYQAEVKYNT
ncbi:lytic transglycosylase domain-containing protein [bacterium]|nr:lytic transglycosylase domain-containing protein [bacterium]